MSGSGPCKVTNGRSGVANALLQSVPIKLVLSADISIKILNYFQDPKRLIVGVDILRK